jgi:Lrp/AsnC family transcriptional regulator, leucine-responsive regulatory protein
MAEKFVSIFTPVKGNIGNIISLFCFKMKKYSPIIELDATDLKILRILQEDGRLSNAELAERVSLSPSPCWKRLKRLEDSGVIRGYQANINRQALGLGVVGFVSILLDNHTQKTCRAFEAGALAMPEVMACYNITGEYDYLLQVLVEDLESYSTFVLEKVRTLSAVKELHSTLSLRELKWSSKVWIAGG